MQNIEYLSERDLKYFEKKEALGEAIIIRIEPEALLSLDLDALFQERTRHFQRKSWRVSYRETSRRSDRRSLTDRRKDKILSE